MPRSTMIFPIVLLCIGVDLLSFIGSLSNEICHFPRFFRGQRHQLAAYLFALEIISHIMTQCSKSRKALTVLHYFLRCCSMHHVPITRRNNRHLHQTKILVQLIPCSRRSGSSSRHNRRCRFQIESSAASVQIGIKSTVQKRSDCTGSSCPVDRRSEYKAIIILCQCQKIVYRILKHAAIAVIALVTGDTAGNRLIANSERIGINPVLIECLRHRTQCCIGAAFPVRAAIYKQYLHDSFSSLV